MMLIVIRSINKIELIIVEKLIARCLCVFEFTTFLKMWKTVVIFFYYHFKKLYHFA